MKAFVLSLFKGTVAAIMEQVSAAAMQQLQAELDKSTVLKPEEKAATLNGANLLLARIKEQVEKQINK